MNPVNLEEGAAAAGTEAAAGAEADGGEETADEAAAPLVCPFCAEPLSVEPDTLYCEACGEPLAEPVTGEEEQPAAKRVCISCGGTVIDGEGYCTDCGDLQPRARDRMEADLGVLAGISDKGRRHHRNEDSMALRPAVWPDGRQAAVAVVCDGVSSSHRPDAASAAAAATAARLLLTAVAAGADPIAATEQAARSANRAAADEATDSDHGDTPACTYVSVLVTAPSAAIPGEVTVGWLGDSRAYWLDEDGGSRLLTADDTWATAEIASGRMTEAAAYADPRSHAIAAWLGADSGEPDPHTAVFRPTGPGVVLVCSDGLWNYVWDADDLTDIALPEAQNAPFPAAARLVQKALDSGGHDNVTVVLIPYPPAAIGSDQPVPGTTGDQGTQAVIAAAEEELPHP